MGLLALADVAAEQWGLFTAAQAQQVGQSHQALVRLAARGAIERLSHGVYRLTGAPSHPLDGIRVAWLTLDPATSAAERLRCQDVAVVSHRSAAQLHHLGDVDADRHEFTTPHRKQSRRADVRLHRGHLPRGDWTLVEGLPVTTPTRTIRDLAAGRLDGGHLAGVVRDALVDHYVDLAELAAALRPFAQHYGAPMGDTTALVQRFVTEAGVPGSTRQVVHLADPDVRNTFASLAELARVPALQEQLATVFRPEFLASLRAAAERGQSQVLEPAQDDEENGTAHA